MPTNVSAQNSVIASLQRKAPNARCPLCGISNWAVHDGVIYFHQEAHAGFTTDVSRTLPSVAVVCQNCGNTHFVSLAIATPSILKDVTENDGKQ